MESTICIKQLHLNQKKAQIIGREMSYLKLADAKYPPTNL